MTKIRMRIPAFLVLTVASSLVAHDSLPADQFASLRKLIRPHAGESQWREVEWLTSLHAARERAAVEGKPILLWSGGGAPPLGGC
jgi:hypothetical protein